MSAHERVKYYFLDIRERSGILVVMRKHTKGRPRKDPHAVALGRKGGLKGGPARKQALTPEQRSESARKAVLARWAKRKVEARSV